MVTIVNDLIVGALHEGRIDGNERLKTFDRHASSKGNSMLLSNPDIKGSIKSPNSQ